MLVVFGGSKDGAFNQEISDLVGTDPGLPDATGKPAAQWPGATFSGEDIAIILRPEEIRQLPERHALVIAENGKPIIARLTRCIDGRAGARLLAGQQHLRAELAEPTQRGLDCRGPGRRGAGRGATSRHRRRAGA